MNLLSSVKRVVSLRSADLFTCRQSSSELAFGSVVEIMASRNAIKLKVPEHFLVQLLSIEDKRFFYHCGVDPIAIVRAMTANCIGRGVLQGASTITQQLYNAQQSAKGYQRYRTLSEKVSQATWALAEELRHSKIEILSEYLETIYWGRSYIGIDEAAAGYFHTTREQLTIAQSFFLVERLASPNLVLINRIEELLQKQSIAKFFVNNTDARAELAEIYSFF